MSQRPLSVVKDLAAIRRRQEAHKRQSEAEGREVSKDFQKLQKAIKEGRATSGNPLRDYFIVGGDPDHPALPLARKIERQMKGKKGELVLIIERSRERHVFRGCFGGEGARESDYHVEEHHTLGVLAGETFILDLKKFQSSVPTAAHISADGMKAEKADGPYLLSGRWFHGGLEMLTQHVSGGRDSGKALEFVVGDKAVFGYTPGYFFPRQHSEWLVLCNQLARVLGKEVPEAPEEVAARAEAQKSLLAELDAARDALKAYNARIGELRVQLRRTDNESDLPLVAPYRERDECVEKLKALVARAQKIGLKDNPLIKLVECEITEKRE